MLNGPYVACIDLLLLLLLTFDNETRQSILQIVLQARVGKLQRCRENEGR